MKARTLTLIAVVVLTAMVATANASPTLATGSTPPLPGTRVPTAKLDGWVTLMARVGLITGEQTGIDASIEMYFIETMGFGFGFIGGEQGTTYLRLTYAMLDVKYWVWTGYIDFLSDIDGINLGTALSIPVHDSHNYFFRIGISTFTEGDFAFTAGVEAALW